MTLGAGETLDLGTTYIKPFKIRPVDAQLGAPSAGKATLTCEMVNDSTKPQVVQVWPSISAYRQVTQNSADSGYVYYDGAPAKTVTIPAQSKVPVSFSISVLDKRGSLNVYICCGKTKMLPLIEAIWVGGFSDQ